MKADPKTVRIEWDSHNRSCPHCRKYEYDKPATLAYVCLKGAPLIKGVLELDAQPGRASQRRHENEVYRAVMKITPESGPTTKKKAQAAMRFKE